MVLPRPPTNPAGAGTLPTMLHATSLDRRRFLRQSAGLGLGAAGLLGTLTTAKAQESPTKSGPVRVRVWCEGTAPPSVYPEDVDGALGEDLARRPGLAVARARLADPDAGLSDADLDATDVLIWWGRLRHDDVPDDRAGAVVDRVRAGRLGLVALHASYASKPFRGLMGTPCEPGGWREDGRPERVESGPPTTRSPAASPRSPSPDRRPVARTLRRSRTRVGRPGLVVGRRRDLPQRPDLDRRRGRVAYFRPGHDAFPVLFHPSVRQVVANAALWAAKRT